MSERIGIMGGMFDPVHRGHVRVALAAAGALSLQRVHMVPCARPNHREGAAASSADRLAMLELVCRDRPLLRPDERELHRPGLSYTVDTLEQFREEFPDALLVFIQGWDSFLGLPRWKRWRQLFEQAHLCVVSRPGSSLPRADSRDPDERTLAGELAARQVVNAAGLEPGGTGGILVLEGVDCDISSTALRHCLARRHQGDPAVQRELGQWLEPAVSDWIDSHRLY